MLSPTLAHAFEQQFPAIVTSIAHTVLSKAGGGYQHQAFEEFRARIEPGVWLMEHDFAKGTVEYYPSYWLTTGLERARIGFAIEEMLEAISLTNEIVIEHLAPFYAGDIDATQTMIRRVYAICDRAKSVLFSAFTQAREEIIREQTVAIQELSAPLIPIYRGVLVLPLIGAIDSQRAGTIMESLLDGIARRRASVVLLDITGVPVVDTSVAHHLLQAARAVRLLGAEIVLVGISPEIAQTIVQLGVDLSKILTRSDLQAGFAYALELLGLRVGVAGRAVLNQ
jgi:rsbT co-antagonist protein RsbR